MSSITLKIGTLNWLFRLRDEKLDFLDPLLDETYDIEVPGIRCPLCKWRPRQSDFWMCWDCDHPEYFYGGCGTEWNAFDTRG